MTPNERALLRYVDKAFSILFQTDVRISMSQPVPTYLFKLHFGNPAGFELLTISERVALENAGLAMESCPKVLEVAASAGQLDSCKLLRSHGCPWGSMISLAAYKGHHHVVEWALASGCPVTPDAIYMAARGGHESLTLQLLERVTQDAEIPISIGSSSVLSGGSSDSSVDGGDSSDSSVDGGSDSSVDGGSDSSVDGGDSSVDGGDSSDSSVDGGDSSDSSVDGGDSSDSSVDGGDSSDSSVDGGAGGGDSSDSVIVISDSDSTIIISDSDSTDGEGDRMDGDRMDTDSDSTIIISDSDSTIIISDSDSTIIISDSDSTDGDGAQPRAPRGGVDPLALLEEAARGMDLAGLRRLYEWLRPELQYIGVWNGGDDSTPMLEGAVGSPTADWQAKALWAEERHAFRTVMAYVFVIDGRTGDSVPRMLWLLAREYPLDEDISETAVMAGDLAALRFLMELHGMTPNITEEHYSNLVANSSLDILQYLHERGVALDMHQIASHAAKGGNLQIMSWVLDGIGLAPNNHPSLLDDAVLGGNMELLFRLWQMGWQCSSAAIVNAVTIGWKAALVQLRAWNCPWPDNNAPWWVANGPWLVAAKNGDLATIRNLHQLGCPWGTDALLPACIMSYPRPSVHVLRLLVELGCPVEWITVRVVAEAQPLGEYRAALLVWLNEELYM
ncbi:hypothetical protein PLESTB_000876100 [Pleodorina starrii]|uniref:Ankyrin repeat protein n=1 Tax=Pleodorina starrii TaxID=330485 RepID=A0A9W6BLT2_9CHLO|nr:hypothetical protein PLESTB_000876100 [Pleodorina starrii]